MKAAKINNLVIFDFCETLCKYQTANHFVDFASHNTNMSFLNKLLSFFSSNRLLISLIWLIAPRFNFSKRTKLFSLKGCSESVLLDRGRSYFDKCKYDLHDIVVEKLKHHVSIGDHVIIVSGGYEIYLSYFKNHFGISAVLGTKIKFKNNFCCGTIEGSDCMFMEKISRIKSYIEDNQLFFENTISYTDSITDIDLLRFSDKPYVISLGNSQKWAISNGFEEIIIKD
jgi:HAD superfamily phosphoserine phosphatase-like hydrolase